VHLNPRVCQQYWLEGLLTLSEKMDFFVSEGLWVQLFLRGRGRLGM
jgi:hypothetical protein